MVEVKALPNPPSACVTILGGLVCLLKDWIVSEKGGSILMKVNEETKKKEEDWFTTAKKYLFDNPEGLKNMMLIHFDKEK